MPVTRLYTIVLLLLVAPLCSAETLRVAVASNFKTTLEAVVEEFEANSEHRVIIASGSTGKHYAQIRNGAPFDLFFAADARRPRLLEQQGHSVADSRFTYAIGKLVLWSPQPGYVDDKGQVLETGTFRRLAMANPRLAPYGLAAKQVLQQRGLYERLQSRLVRGENIAQTFQFVATGNAQLGFVALSQLHASGLARQGSLWTLPESLYDPIEQQAVMLNDTPAARAFLTYIKSEPAGRILRRFGYATPSQEGQ
ncbi:molybdate ABC transporter substrate-binding protein [Thiohalophilus thiocyanatoxydans]|uniref:Molybdate transport system substrate-binding protein n=1 Tax=Thiohalophilus thiocyanatoxydans TaxID=381308 RepID=A0A4R8IPE9_9GAMM|nr:molybdate ABC transporter substrate-binding protein [Thiohalophilus thiocyanatoxydans]TDX99268.1 molybdate transport system substrate-binding protein [Thiohalophilus thiocyanatoxydans]